MSALKTSDDTRPTNPFRHAPPRARMPQDDGTIRPILERLSRGESAYAPLQQAMPAGVDPVETGRGRRGAWAFIGCAALSAMLSAGVAIGAVSWLGSGSRIASASASAPAATESKPAEVVDLGPKTVRTLSFKPDTAPKADAIVKEQASIAPAADPAPATPPALAAAAPAAEASPAPQPAQTASVDASTDGVTNPLLSASPPTPPKELLAHWSGVPATVGAAQPAETPAPPPREAKEDTPTAAAAESTHHRAASRASHRHARVHRRHHARTQTAHVQAAPAQQPASPQATAQPANALQAFQSLFNGGGGGAQSQAPVASFSGN
jgi:hypothetical protein